MTVTSIPAYAAVNRTRVCRVPSCNGNRTELSPYCRLHAAKVETTGHPEGRTIKAKEYATEKQMVERFLTKHRQHEGVVSALGWIQRWLDAANFGEKVPGQSEMARLHAHGVSPFAILVEAASLFLYSRWRPRSLPDDQRLDYAIGYRVLSLVPREKYLGSIRGRPAYRCKRIGKVPRREVGRRIRVVLAALLAGIVVAIEAEEAEQRQFVSSLYLPFNTNPTPKTETP